MNGRKWCFLSAALFSGVAPLATAGETWFVDANRYEASGSDGLTEATAFGTIQAAVDAASAGDTIKVLPGTYDTGWTQDEIADSGVKARVLVNKRLRIESTGGASATHIVGAGDFSTRTDGLGDDAVRCVSVFQAAKGTVLKGFTFRDGHSRWYDNKNCNATHGGAVQYLGYDGPGVTIADSVVSNNVATRAGAVHRATLVRTLLTHNRASNNGGSATRNCRHYACILAHNGDTVFSASRSAIADSELVANCTIIGNGNGGVFCDTSDRTKIYNSVIILSGNNMGYDLRSINLVEKITGTTVLRNIVYDTAQLNGNACETASFTCVAGRVHETLVSPFAGDYRAVWGGPCDGTGDTALVAVDGIDAEFRGLDFYGNPLVTDGKVNIGAVAASAKPVGGVHVFRPSTSFTIDGAVKSTVYGEEIYLRRPETPSVICLRDRGTLSIFNVVQSGAWSWRHYFDLTGKLYLNMPPQGNIVTNLINLAARIVYVDPVNGNDEFNGLSPTNGTDNAGPKKTLVSAVYTVPAKWRGIVRAAEGVYDEGCSEGGGWTNRVVLWGDKHILLKGAGAGKSVIKGELDTTEEDQGGCGRSAMRCVYAKQAGGYDLCVQGFTLADGAVLGHATGPSSPYEAGAFFAGESGSFGQLSQLVDCVVTNCAGSRGAVMFGGWAQRCVFKGNHYGNPGSELFRNTGMSACVIQDNNPEKRGVNTVANGTLVFINTTFCGNSNSNWGTTPYSQFGSGSLVMNTVISGDSIAGLNAAAVVHGNYQSYYNFHN